MLKQLDAGIKVPDLCLELGVNSSTAFGLVPQDLSAPPDLDVEQLLTLLADPLGFEDIRSFEEHKGVASK